MYDDAGVKIYAWKGRSTGSVSDWRGHTTSGSSSAMVRATKLETDRSAFHA